MSKFASTEFWVGTFDRAVSTFAQTALGSIVVGTTGLLTLDWVGVASLAGAAALASVLQSIAFRGAPEGASGKHAYDPRDNGLGGSAPEV